jgi:thiamine monophosphate synthase
MHVLAISPGEGLDPARWKPVLRSGIDALMVREKHLEARALLDLVRWCQDLCPDLPIWVNGRLDVALAARCGLHAPEAYPDVSHGLVPLSRPLHEASQFVQRSHCDQLLVAPVFAVPGKDPVWGVPALHAALENLPPSGCRILALGGITPENTGSLRHPRLAGVALMRSLWGTAEPKALVGATREAWERTPL